MPPQPVDLSSHQTAEPSFTGNRPGDRPSYEEAATPVDRSILLSQGGFCRFVLRGDTNFSQTEHPNRWHDLPWVRFVFGYDARPTLQQIAKGLSASAWTPLRRPPRYEVKSQPRQRPVTVQDRIEAVQGLEGETAPRSARSIAASSAAGPVPTYSFTGRPLTRTDR